MSVMEGGFKQVIEALNQTMNSKIDKLVTERIVKLEETINTQQQDITSLKSETDSLKLANLELKEQIATQNEQLKIEFQDYFKQQAIIAEK